MHPPTTFTNSNSESTTSNTSILHGLQLLSFIQKHHTIFVSRLLRICSLPRLVCLQFHGHHLFIKLLQFSFYYPSPSVAFVLCHMFTLMERCDWTVLVYLSVEALFCRSEWRLAPRFLLPRSQFVLPTGTLKVHLCSHPAILETEPHKPTLLHSRDLPYANDRLLPSRLKDGRRCDVARLTHNGTSWTAISDC